MYRVDLASGERTLVERNDDEIGNYHADANYALHYAERSRPDGSNELLRRAGDGWEATERIPFEDTQTTIVHGLSADGSTLYLFDSRDRDTAAVYALDVASGQRRLMHADPRADFIGAVSDPRTREPQAAVLHYQYREWIALNPVSDADFAHLGTLGKGNLMVTSRTLDDRRWIVSYDGSQEPGAFYRYDRDGRGGGELTRLFTTRPDLDGKPLARMWPKTITSRDGKTLISYLTLPHTADANADGSADTPVPMVLLAHGGPWDRDIYGFNAYHQLLANRGYAVLSVNFRGSTGLGKAFTNAGDRQWGKGMHDDLIDAVHWAIAEGVTTPDRVAIMGGSYGGYATLVGMTMTPDTFACGVDIFGPSNLVTMFESFPTYWATFMEQLYRRVGDPRTEEGRQALLAISPLTHANNIKRPLLIAQGANDPRVVQAESDRMVEAMQANNIPVTYVLFPDEGHGFARPQNDMAFQAVSERFLQQCLSGRAQPIGDDFNGSSISVPAGADDMPGLVDALNAHEQVIRN